MSEELKIDPDTKQLKSIGTLPEAPKPALTLTCAKHGKHNATMQVVHKDEVLRNYCLYCYMDCMDKAVEQMAIVEA